MIQIPNTIPRTAVCGAMLVAAQAVHAGTSVTLSALGTDGGESTSAINEPVENSYTYSRFGDRQSGRWADEIGAAWGRSPAGWLRLKSDGSCTAQSNIGSWGGQGSATAETYWQDVLTVNGGPAVHGMAGEMTVTLVIDGSLALGGGDPYAGTPFANGSSAYFFIQTAMNGYNGKYGENQNFQGGIQMDYVEGGGTETKAYNGNFIGPGTWQVKFSFSFGQQSQLFILSKASVAANAVVYSAADGVRFSQASSDFRAGVRWAGITEIRVANGAVVPDCTITSTSGFYYLAGIQASPFALTQFDIAPGGVTLSWTDSAMRSYTVEMSTSLNPGIWSTVPDVTWPITANTIVLPA
jgi:hypothetical protein